MSPEKGETVMQLHTKAYKGLGMNGVIATWYAKNTDRSLNAYREDARQVAAYLAPGSRLLEIAPGPGYQAIELAKLGDYTITGVDISPAFVRIASENARAAGVNVEFRHGNAADLPFTADTFDLIYCRAAFKNFASPLGTLKEMYRVLRHGGIALIQDLRPDATHDAISETVRRMRLSRVNACLTTWIFKHMLIKRAHPRERLQAMAAASPFKTYEIDETPMAYNVVMKKG
jgi:ubiquinone/menaquinone biosynthesis C-methylase UbiE